MFFHPLVVSYLTPKLYLAEGDLFFSRRQTITISVNTVGVMGKGLASRAKYQFPGVYVFYQDLCRNRKFTMGRLQLYLTEMQKNGFFYFQQSGTGKSGLTLRGLRKG